LQQWQSGYGAQKEGIGSRNRKRWSARNIYWKNASEIKRSTLGN